MPYRGISNGSLRVFMASVVGLMLLVGTATAQNLEQFEKLTNLIDSARVQEADIFSPQAWEKGQESFQKADLAVKAGKTQKDIDKKVNLASEYVESAIKTTEVTKLTLKEYLDPRDKAKQAKAPELVPEIYDQAEMQFIKAASKIESGDVKGALKEVEKSTSLFAIAEMEAIREEILGKADKLIEKALADDAGKYALATLDKAQSARKKTDAILTDDRYNRTTSVEESARSEYEARHASNIALSVRSLNKNDQAWEKLMLLYEIQMDRVGKAMDIETLPFDNGPLAAADAMIKRIGEVKSKSANISKNSDDLSGDLMQQLKAMLARTNTTSESANPMALAQDLDAVIAKIMDENAVMSKEYKSTRQNLTDLESSHKEVEAALAVRVEQEEKFKKAKMMINPSEGEVLFNSSNDIVLRLGGLSFDVGQDKIKDEHIPLLEKVNKIIGMFPESKLVVEGHTDASGEPTANVQLSEKRAYAVMQYIRQSLLISADRMQSIGYGMDRPIGSNKTEDGRAMNRRIDVIIMR